MYKIKGIHFLSEIEFLIFTPRRIFHFSGQRVDPSSLDELKSGQFIFMTERKGMFRGYQSYRQYEFSNEDKTFKLYYYGYNNSNISVERIGKKEAFKLMLGGK